MRFAEFLLLFFGLVGVYIAIDVPGGPIPVLLAAGVLVVLYLRRQRVSLAGPRDFSGVLGLWALVSVLTVAAMAVFDRDNLFVLPRENPGLWLAIIVFYPLVSVYPQELLYRAFLLHRYEAVWGTGKRAAAASAVAFGFAHLLFGNVIAVVSTVIGGWLFARRYQRTGSLLVVSVEHALYGITIFTVGLGQYFYHGA
ncbi:CPBP family glutamic-type intramembrane protease [Paractinoplanes maris]|uniref:CPBP family glutamic-type intramembrane protease n=1 Tax=Paractinoplanes maris TaxID=1734446 RepID=UPI00202007CD|nr:CPBP family glutamic-type intramembrane protease [Actinoplanes maris]